MIASLESVIIAIHSIIAFHSIFLNILLMYCLLFHTPSSFATFGIMLKFHAFVDLITALASTATMQRLVSIEFSLFYISCGPCGYVGATACYISYSLMLFGADCALYSLLASFVFRLKAVVGPHPTTRDVFALIVGIALPLPTIITVALLSLRYDDDDAVVRGMLMMLRPQYEAEKHVVTGHTDIRTIRMFIVIFIIAFCTPISFVILLRIRSRILASIASRRLSTYSMKLNRKFVTMLTAQASIMLLQYTATNFAWINLILGFTDVVQGPALESLCYLCVEAAALFSPLIVLTSIDIYKRAALGILCCRVSCKVSVSSSSNLVRHSCGISNIRETYLEQFSVK